MKKQSNILTAILAVIVVGIISIIPALNSCGGVSSCDGKRCKEAIGFNDGKKPSERNAAFKANNPLEAKKFNVFVESSASMDGYVNGNTHFKTIIHRLIGQVVADVLNDENNISLNYINSIVINQKTSAKNFTKNLSPASFSKAGGDRTNSNIIDIIEEVVKNTGMYEVSMFVSDCIYSPESATDIDKALDKQRTDMLNILKKKDKKNPEFGVLLYRLTSDFHGIYYTKTNAPINCNGPRPYFIWFMGDASILSNVANSVAAIMRENKAESIIGIPQYSYLPYLTIRGDHPYHYLSAKTNAESLFTFSFLADMSYLPLDKSYLLDIKNYSCAKNKYYIKKIEEFSNAEKGGYNYKYTVCIRGGKNAFVTPTLVEISLKSMLTDLPSWIEAYDDPLGTDYDNGYNSKKLRTFGLSSLANGIKDFYNSPDYITFRIQIN